MILGFSMACSMGSDAEEEEEVVEVADGEEAEPAVDEDEAQCCEVVTEGEAVSDRTMMPASACEEAGGKIVDETDCDGSTEEAAAAPVRRKPGTTKKTVTKDN
jgi:hypothetical protein